VLIAPLDWGLGHTTRCIPIIKEFRDNKIRVIVACNDQQKTFLKQEFSDLETVYLGGYDIRYSFNKVRTTLKLFLQSGKILTSIKKENRILRQILHDVPIDLVISDNRYGFHNVSVYSIIITHQLTIKTGLGSTINRLISRQLLKYINHFDETWIPDNERSPKLAGALSTPDIKKGNQIFIGPLSRLNTCENITEKHLLIVLSGPEPQRTILETLIFKSSTTVLNESIVLVRGSSSPSTIPIPTGIIVYDFAESSLLNQLMCNASIIISRSGYTSVMDILKLKKRWVAIPTPGQAEQEYLADYLHQNNWALAIKQQDFNLSHALAEACRFQFEYPSINSGKYKETISRLLSL